MKNSLKICGTRCSTGWSEPAATKCFCAATKSPGTTISTGGHIENDMN